MRSACSFSRSLTRFRSSPSGGIASAPVISAKPTCPVVLRIIDCSVPYTKSMVSRCAGPTERTTRSLPPV
tara:strand:+ start:2431 stop:2640 length:210 start_codon:yes stop_codon:yes gene_type:complete